MKGFAELKISPHPWSCVIGAGGNHAVIRDADGEEITDLDRRTFGYEESGVTSDAMLMSAAPELYSALHEAVVEMCHMCGSSADNGISCTREGKTHVCFVQRWRAVLEKAGGVE